MATQIVLDQLGNRRYYFDAHDPAEVFKARKRFETLRARGFVAAILGSGDQTAVVRAFSAADETLFYPGIVGGRTPIFVKALGAAQRTIWRSLPDWAAEAQIFHDGRVRREFGGERLLTEWLSSQQRAQFEANRWFDVIGPDIENHYRIYCATWANVQELDSGGEPRLVLCFRTARDLSPSGRMLAQKIALETDERATLAIAKRCPIGLDRRSAGISPRKRAF